jgi:dipeptidyl aminopeptidase/acylaminoacyl peptidase
MMGAARKINAWCRRQPLPLETLAAKIIWILGYLTQSLGAVPPANSPARNRLLLTCAASAWAIVALGAPASQQPNLFEGADLFRLEWASDPQIRPDGRAVAYVRRGYEIMSDRVHLSIWTVDSDTGAQTPIVAGPASYDSPRWSPDGTRIAYIARFSDGRSELMVRWMQSGTEARIADLSESPSDLTWSPSGKFIAFELFTPSEPMKLGEAPRKPEGAKWADSLEIYTSVDFRRDGDGYARPGEAHLHVVSADGGVPRQLTFGAYGEEGPLAWTPDGLHILFSGQRTSDWQLDPQNAELYSVAVVGGGLTQLTHHVGPISAPAVSPDGSKIAYLGFDDRLRSYENTRLYIMNSDGGTPRSLTDSLDRSVDAAVWSADGKSFYITYVDRGKGKVAQVTLEGRIDPIAEGLSSVVLDRPYSGGAFSVARNGAIAFTSGTPMRPSDISIVRDGRVFQITHLNDDLFRNRPLAEVRSLNVTSTYDHRSIDAWLVMPPGGEKGKHLPLILEIHGGPFGSYGPVFSTDDQLYAAAGYAVVYANPRGSTSYGAEFANLIHHDYPSHDYDDLMSAVDAAIATGSVDPDELFVTGGSGGGTLTAWIVGKTHRFRAAASQKPVFNWSSQSLATDLSTYDIKYWFAKPPWEDYGEYWRHSPMSLMGEVTTPTLVIVGDRDYRTTESEADQYYKALQLRRVPSALIRVPGASHGGLAARPSQSAAKASAIISWFNRYRNQAANALTGNGAIQVRPVQ